MTTAPISFSTAKGKQKFVNCNVKQKYPFEGFNIEGEGPTQLMSSFLQLLNVGLYKHHAKNANVFPEYENKIVNIIEGFRIPTRLPWHLTHDVYVYVNCNGEFHWVLVVFKEWWIKVYNSMYSSRINRKLSGKIQKLSTILPRYLNSTNFLSKKTEPTGQLLNLTRPRTNLIHSKDCGLFVAAYAEFLSDGLQVPSYGIISESVRMKYASLL
ncbi:hypothetical protein R3W88_008141 [Solanum pinnatisectum]|uniref:Ubiquitin-like protease family profile domain-containing protein n=1 Tax=Solanum pinnatisectum TaxID=50273 RepID=A0AAV9MAI0_9SOLN|nr:hypothetical protein R3W88_008141 [Solanum pinnatisectum]